MASAAHNHYSLSTRLRERLDRVEIGPRTRRLAAIAGLVAVGLFFGAAVGLAGTPGAILAFAAVACVFCVRDFRVGVALLIVIMPVSQSYVFPHAMLGITGLNPLNLLMMATLVAMIMRVAGDGTLSRFLPRSVILLYILPMAYGVAMGLEDIGKIPGEFKALELVYFDTPFGYVRDYFLKPLTFVFYALLVASAVLHSRKPERFLVPMLISVWAMALIVVVFTIESGASLADMSGTFARSFFSPLGMHANDLGRLYAVAYAILLFVWDRTEHMGQKTLMLVAMGLVVIALLLTFSRGSFFGFIVVNAIYLFSRRRVKTLLAASLLIPAALWMIPGAVWYRMTMGFDSGLNEVSAGRTSEIWGPLAPTLLDNPIFGNGLGSILWSEPMLEGRLLQVAHPHNAYLQLYMDMGIVGLVLITGFWILMWRRFRQMTHDSRVPAGMQGFFEGAAAGLIAFLIAGFAGSSFMPVPEQAFMWLAVGVMYGYRQRFQR